MTTVAQRMRIWVLTVHAILAIPLIAMQFTSEVQWTGSDFLIMGMLLMSAAFLFELGMTMVKTSKQKVLVGVLVLFALVWLWAELAVGVFTNWGS